jgi:regulator of sirC expression with transglutaminase-like and TPR domain
MALALEPSHPEALLERGILHLADGETARARADWQRVIAVAPDSPAAAAARNNLARLDGGG